MLLRHSSNSPTLVRTASRSAIIALWAIVLTLLAGRAAHAEFKLSIDLKDGAKIHDVAKIVAHADSSDGIDKVEFFVDDQLKATATGVPYTLKWDTIADKEGKHTLAITAYDANGQTKKLSVSLEIDNELALGAEALAQKGHEALAAGDTDTAIAYCRRSLKAEPNNLSASRITAALAAKDSDWDKAVSALESATGYDSNPDSLRELAMYKTRKALLPENASTFTSALQSIGELRQKAADLFVDKVKAKDPSAHEAVGDALLRAGHYKEAQLEYQKSGNGMPISTSNRVALAYTLQDQIDLAIAFLRPLVQEKIADRVTRAVYGLALLHKQEFDQARAAVAQDLASEYPAALVIAAYADVVNGQSAKAKLEAESAVKLAPQAGDAHYVNSMIIRNLTDSEEELTHTMTLSPFSPGPVLDYAARIALQKQNDRMDDALKLTEYVLHSDPTNVEAKLANVLLLLIKGRVQEAAPTLEYVMVHTKAADVQMVGAVFLTQDNKAGLAGQRWDQARKLDPNHFDFLVVPTAAQFFQTYMRKLHYRAGFYLTFESLFPVKMAPKPEPATTADPTQ